MITRLLVAAACLGLLAGCGGFGGLVPFGSQPQAPLTENDDPGGDGLSARHLEKLYAQSGLKDWDPSLEAELQKWEHQAKFDMPIQMNKQVKAYLVYFATDRKAVVRRWLARSSRYLPMIKQTFQEYGLPEDLAYLAMIESGFNPNAGSPAGAVGLWQFIKGTGLRYGLVINRTVDERRDPVKSTRAAARYLTDLYQQFGSWYLAAASYNCGEGRVQKELHKSSHRTFWDLSANRCLPSETKNYVPQLIAATIIAKNPEKFGFGNVPYQAPASEVQLARATVAPVPGVSGGTQKVAARSAPVPPPHKPPVYAQSRPKASSRAPAAPRAVHRSPAVAPNSGPPAARMAHARHHKTDSTPYVASLFGSHAPAAPKSRAAKAKPHRPTTVLATKKKSSRLAGRHKNRKPTTVARGRKLKDPKAKKRRQVASKGKKGRPARTGGKTILAARAW